jgi:hypothetical protein
MGLESSESDYFGCAVTADIAVTLEEVAVSSTDAILPIARFVAEAAKKCGAGRLECSLPFDHPCARFLAHVGPAVGTQTSRETLHSSLATAAAIRCKACHTHRLHAHTSARANERAKEGGRQRERLIDAVVVVFVQLFTSNRGTVSACLR